ncbi:MAG TPA: PH domain-containing protein [Allosphingosinicella sp.]|nr:PH domain-containing protein [Allosphingosinicella sp.]
MALVLLGAALFGEAALSLERAIPPGLVAGPALLIALLLVLVMPERRYRAWGYEVTEDELHVQNGIWLRTHTIVPFGRVQHIDVSQGPFERRYGVGALTLHTAGTRASAVVLPGLGLDDAERLRDEIRGQIRQDLI